MNSIKNNIWAGIELKASGSVFFPLDFTPYGEGTIANNVYSIKCL